MSRLVLVILFSLGIYAQVTPPPGSSNLVFANPPGGIGGACTNTGFAYLVAAGNIYTCQSLVWTTISGSGTITGLTTNLVAKAASATTLANSSITDDGTTITSSEAVNFSATTHSRPVRVTTAATITASTCTQGEFAFATDATAGTNLYFCTATNVWTQQVTGTVLTVSGNNGLTSSGGNNPTLGLAAQAQNTVLCNNAGGSNVPIPANCTVTGTGNAVLATAPSITSPVLTTPRVNTIADNNGNIWLTNNQVAATVDGLCLTPSATGNPATVTLTVGCGSDANINLNITSKGTGQVQCNGGSCGGGGNAITNLTTDVSANGPGVAVATIQPAAVTLAKMANLAPLSILGNNTVSAATPIALTATQATAMLNQFTGAAQGLVGASGGGSLNFLRADGQWVVPPGSGGGAPGGSTFSTQTNAGGGLFAGQGPGSAGQLFVAQGAGGPALFKTIGQDCAVDLNGNFTCTKTNNVALTSAATTALGTSGATIPLNNSNNTFSGTNSFTGTLIASSAVHTTPEIVVATVPGLPALCTQGELAFVQAATAGNQIYECSSANTWSQQGGGITQLTGDVAAGPGTGPQMATIQPGAVSLNKIANINGNTFLGNNTGSAAAPTALNQAQATALLNIFTNSLAGTVPGSGGGTTNFLRADATWSQIPSSYNTVDSNGTAATQRPTLNLISGTGSTVNCVDNSGSTRTDCTISASASGFINYGQSFTTQTTVVLTNNYNTANVNISCYDGSGNRVEPGSVAVAQTTPFAITVNFAVAQTGYCVVNGSGGVAPANYFQSFTTQTTVVLTPGLGTANEITQCFTSAGVLMVGQLTSITTAQTTPFNVTVVMSPAQTGYCVVNAFQGGGGITTLSGDVSAGPGNGSQAATINSGAVTLAKQANLAANSIEGNNTGSPATPIALTQAQVTAMINTFTAGLKGLAPASGGGTTNFLRADGTWAAPAGGGTTSVYNQNTVASGATPNFDLSLGNFQQITALATNAVATFTNIQANAPYVFLICQNATGGSFTWPASVHGGSTIQQQPNTCSKQDFIANSAATALYGSPGLVGIP